MSQIKPNILSFQQLPTGSTPELPRSKHLYNLVLVLGMKKAATDKATQPNAFTFCTTNYIT